MPEFLLPSPPSANNLFYTDSRTRTRHKSAEYRAWEKAAGDEFYAQRFTPIAGRVKVRYEFHRPDKRKRDLCNLEKAVSDLLVKHGVFEDDCLIWEATLLWTAEHPGRMKATVTPYEGAS